MHSRRDFARMGCAVIAFAALAAPGVGQAAEYTLKYADSLPTTHYSVPATKRWIAEVEARSEGRIEIEHYPAEQLASARDLLDAVQNRIADIAYIPAQYFAEKLPLATVGSLPIPEVDADLRAVMHAYMDLGRGVLDEVELKDAGIKALRASSTEPYNLHMTEKKIVALSDLEGQKVRVGGNVQQETMTALGGIPVTVTPPEIYNAMQNGTLNGTVFHLPSIHSYKLNDLVKFSTDNLNLGVFTSYTAINRDLFESMPEDLQKILVEVGEDLMDEEAAEIQKLSDQYRETFRAEGIDIYDLSPEVIAETTERLMPIRERWAALYEERNMPAQQVLDAWVEALKKHAPAAK